MRIREVLADLVAKAGDEDLTTVFNVWTVIDAQQIPSVRSSLSHVALDAVEHLDRGDPTAARLELSKQMGNLWPTCDEEDFCPLCASVQSAMFIDGVTIEVEEVRPHLLLLKDKSMIVSRTSMKMIHEYWAANESPEDGYTSIYEGPGFLAFVETV